MIGEHEYGQYAKLQEIKWILYQILRGLHVLSENSIVYRNLTLDHIFVGRGVRKYKIGHLLKAKKLEDDYVKSTFYSEVDTIFTSPELGKDSHNAQTLSLKADVWSFGMLAYHLFFGHNLLEYNVNSEDDECYATMEKKFKEGTWEFPKKATFNWGLGKPTNQAQADRRIEVIEDLKSCIKNCLNLNPEMRPTTSYILNSNLFKEEHKKYGKQICEVQIEGVDDEGRKASFFTVNKNSNNNNNSEPATKIEEPATKVEVTPKNIKKLKNRWQINTADFISQSVIADVFKCMDLQNPSKEMAIKMISKRK